MIVLGNDDPRCAEHAADLFLEGWADFVLISGKEGTGTRGRLTSWQYGNVLIVYCKFLARGNKNRALSVSLYLGLYLSRVLSLALSQLLSASLPCSLCPRCLVNSLCPPLSCSICTSVCLVLYTPFYCPCLSGAIYPFMFVCMCFSVCLSFVNVKELSPCLRVCFYV